MRLIYWWTVVLTIYRACFLNLIHIYKLNWRGVERWGPGRCLRLLGIWQIILLRLWVVVLGTLCCGCMGWVIVRHLMFLSLDTCSLRFTTKLESNSCRLRVDSSPWAIGNLLLGSTLNQFIDYRCRSHKYTIWSNWSRRRGWLGSIALRKSSFGGKRRSRVRLMFSTEFLLEAMGRELLLLCTMDWLRRGFRLEL